MPTKSDSKTTKEGDATTNMSVEMGRGEDGSTKFEMGLKTEASKEKTSAKTEMTASVDGQRCPNAEGQVSFTIKATLGSESGGTGTTQDLTAFVRATVGDDAEISSTTFDVIQATTQTKGGRTIYLETGTTLKYGQDFNEQKESNRRIDQKTDNVTQEDVNKLDTPGLTAARDLGIASLMSAKNAWQDGKCVKIEAPSPGKVEPGSTTSIPVKVISRFDGVDAPSKLTAALTGGASIDPTYACQDARNADLHRSRRERKERDDPPHRNLQTRARLRLELNANTGEKKKTYHVIDTPKIGMGWSGDCIDDLSKPFTVFYHAPGITNSYIITPSSATGGSLVEKQLFEMGGVTMNYTGNGSYTIIPDNKDSDGNVFGMEIVYKTSGNAISCSEGKCVTTKMESGKGVQIPAARAG